VVAARNLAAAVALCAAAAAASRPSAPWPPPAGPLNVIIDADFANEVDDQFALALALGDSGRFRIEGLIAAHFGDAGGAPGIRKSWDEMQRVLEKAGRSGRYATRRGLDPLQYRDRIPQNEGVDLILERARAATPERPLWLVLLGPATDAAAALLQDPSIASRLVVFWHGRTQWPVRAWNFNAYNDIRAVRVIFEKPCRLVLFDTGTYLRIPVEETARRFAPLGPLGAYLHEIRSRRPNYASPAKGFFDLGDIAALADPSIVRWERVNAPAVDHDLRYDFTRHYGEIVRIYHVETEPAFNLLEQALRRLPAR
jgi:inosine-uridine nucleoside N-ribohydrolase